MTTPTTLPRAACEADYALFMVLAASALLAARQAAPGGVSSPSVAGGSLGRRETALSSEVPAGVVLHAPAGQVARGGAGGGDLVLIEHTLRPDAQNGRASHESLI